MTLKLEPHALAIKMKDVRYHFDPHGREVISNLHLAVERGQSLALIGPSGAGKTTLINLLMGFLEPAGGVVELFGMSPNVFIRENPGAVAYVPQFPSIVPGTVFENVALGVPVEEIDRSQVIASLEVAQLGDWFAALKEGGETHLHAASLSGGQIQRLGIARAIYTSPRILFLDEPTGALDGETEFALTEALRQAMVGVTTVTVAHRLSTIEKSNQVLYLVKGRVQGVGSLTELRAQIPAVEMLARRFSLNNYESDD